MTLARPVYAGVASLTTRSCTQQQYLLRPDPDTNNAVIYCLAVAAQRCEVDVLNFVHMSNHLHPAVFDRHGRLPEFLHYFHTLLAKCVNGVRGRAENVFSSHQPSVVRLLDSEALIKELVYVATNPVKDDLVATVDEWPGVNGYRALITGKPLRATRPKVFFSPTGNMPESVTLHLRIPPELGDATVILSEVKKRVKQFERDAATRRAASRKKVLGAYAIRRQSWRDSPTSKHPRRQLSPTFAGRLWARVEASQRKQTFQDEYKEALVAWRAGQPNKFPYGTYWMRRFAGVAVAPVSTVQKFI